MLVTKKNFYFRYTGLTVLDLATVNWMVHVNRIWRPSPGSALAMQSASPAGGAVTVLEPGECYWMVAKDFEWELPDSELVVEIASGYLDTPEPVRLAVLVAYDVQEEGMDEETRTPFLLSEAPEGSAPRMRFWDYENQYEYECGWVAATEGRRLMWVCKILTR